MTNTTDKPSKYDELLALVDDYPIVLARSIRGDDKDSVEVIFKEIVTMVLRRFGWPNPNEGVGFTIEGYEHQVSETVPKGYFAACAVLVRLKHQIARIQLWLHRPMMEGGQWGIRAIEKGSYTSIESAPEVIDDIIFNAVKKFLKCE